MPIDRIVEEVLWPTRQVKEGYTMVRVVTRDGGVFQGYERNEKGDRDLLLRDLSSANLRRIPRKQIASRSKAGSAMPPGLTAGLTRSQLRDLIRYLHELGATKK